MAPTPPRRPAHVRRSQAERSATTRRLLLDTTIDCLVEVGFAGLTQTEVARRAGVSVGALVHHYPTRTILLAAAVEHLLERRQADFRKAMANVDPGADRLDAANDALWSMYQGPTFVAWVELWVAARHDPELADSLAEVDRAFLADSLESYKEVVPPGEGLDDPAIRRGSLHAAFALMDGMALGRLIPSYAPYDTDEVLAVWKGMSQMAVAALRPPPPEGDDDDHH